MKLVSGSVISTFTYDEVYDDYSLGMRWDNRVCETCDGKTWGKNDWNGSVMNTFLNGIYYDDTNSDQKNDYDLKVSARNMIDDAMFYLGGFEYSISTSTEEIYKYERGTARYNDSRPTSWEGKVALMYPSDMYITYAKTDGVECYNQPMNQSVCGNTNGSNNWVYNTNTFKEISNFWTWFLTPISNLSDSVYHAHSPGLASYANLANSVLGVRPVVYLSADAKIIDGDGSINNPYKIGL